MSTRPETVTLAAGELESTWVPGAGMVGASLRHRGAELLGQRGGLEAYVGRGSTFGIPLLYPWANRLGAFRFEVPGTGQTVDLEGSSPLVRTEEHGLPIHGLLAASPGWEVAQVAERSVTAEHPFDGGELLERFPFPHLVAVVVALDEDGLSVTTSVTPTADVPVPLSFGWHPYFAPPGAARADWVLDLPERRHLAVDDNALPTGATEPAPPERGPLGDRTFDDGYDQLVTAVMAVEGGRRRIEVSLGEGYGVTQVFAPPNQDLVALEPMTAPTDALRTGIGLRFAQPGSTFTATYRIAVLPA